MVVTFIVWSVLLAIQLERLQFQTEPFQSTAEMTIDPCYPQNFQPTLSSNELISVSIQLLDVVIVFVLCSLYTGNSYNGENIYSQNENRFCSHIVVVGSIKSNHAMKSSVLINMPQ